MSQQNGDTDVSGTPRYDFEIDLETRSVHTDVIGLVGESRRVLELGPATGYMTRVMRDRGCQVVAIEIDATMALSAEPYCERLIVGDLEKLDLHVELGQDRFDVIVAADVLEHLRDPLAAIIKLREFLTPDGRFVVSLPNIAHGSVRLALLGGHFPYQESGLLDSTHLRFFTRDLVQRLFDDAEMAIMRLERHELNVDASEVPFDAAKVPSEVREMIYSDPDARTYQFVVEAVPLAQPGMRELQRYVSEQADARAAAEARVRDLEACGVHAKGEAQKREAAIEEREAAILEARTAAEMRIHELEQALASLSAREGTLRMSLVEAHDRLLQRDEALTRLEEEARRLRVRAQEADRLSEEKDRLSEEKDRLSEEKDRLSEEKDRLSEELGAAAEEARRLRIRLDRIRYSTPFRAYHRLESLPGLRRVSAHRQLEYDAALKRSQQASGG